MRERLKTEDICYLLPYHFLLKYLVLLIFTSTLLVSTGCEQSFQPLKENNKYTFSIYGYLDASADTQWVRIAPVREQLSTPSVIPPIQVNLKAVESGKSIVMNDSLFSIRGANFINFWATEDIKPGTSYRIEAEGPNGEISRVTMTPPQEYPTPRLRHESGFFGEPDSYTLFIDGVDHLAEIQSKWYIQSVSGGIEEKRVFTFSYRNDVSEPSEGDYRINIVPAEERDRIALRVDEFEVLHRQVLLQPRDPSGLKIYPRLRTRCMHCPKEFPMWKMVWDM